MIKPYYVWFKPGDSHSESARGLKEGEPTQYFPATGYDELGRSYATDYIGPGDRRDFIIARVEATEEEILELFKKPHGNSNAYKQGRTTNYYLNLEDTFTTEEVGEYRDHTKEVNVLPIFSLNTLSDYRLTPERFNKPFVHGSVTEGSHAVGPTFTYSTLKAAIDAVGAVGSNTLTFIIMASHTVSLDIDFDKNTNADGLICIKGNQRYGYKSNPYVSTGGSATQWLFDDECNYLFEDLYMQNVELLYGLADSTTARTHTYRRIYFEEIQTANNLLEFKLFNNNPDLITFKMYDCVINRHTNTPGAREIYLDMRNWDTSDWDSNFFLENNTFIYEEDTSNQIIQIASTSPAGSTFTIRNNVFLIKGSGGYTVNNQSSGTFSLINCAYNIGNNGTVTDTNSITDLVAGDMESTTYTDSNTGDINKDSRLWSYGTADILPENEVDIIGDPLITASPSTGAFSSIAARDPVDSMKIVDSTTRHTTLEIELKEHITGMASYSGDAYKISSYWRDDFFCINGDSISVFKKITILKVDGIALDLADPATAAEVVATSGTWWQDIDNEILYVHFTEDDTPSKHTIIAHFNYYLAETGLILTADGDERYFEPHLDPKVLPSITQKFNDALVGTVNISGGDFTLLNGNGLYDQLFDKYVWQNRQVTIKRGYDDQAYTDYTTISVVKIVGWRLDYKKIIFKVKNKFNDLFEELPGQVFSEEDSDKFPPVTGTTYGSEYPEELIGKPKPLAWGEFNERQAPRLHMIREDLNFTDFTANYSTSSKTDSDMSATDPAYNCDVTFTATDIEGNDDNKTRSFIPTQSGDYFNREEGFWNGYYLYVSQTGEKAKITGFNYDRLENKAEITLETDDPDNSITHEDWTDTNFKIYCPVYHFFVANHWIKSFDAAYVDTGGEEGTREWLFLANDSQLVGTEWTRLVLPIPGYSSSKKVRLAFKSKDVTLGGNPIKETLENHSDVVGDILTNPDILSSPFLSGEIDNDSFANSRADRNYPVAIYLNEPTKAIDILKIIRQSVIAKLMFTLDGKVKYVTWNPGNPVDSNITELTISETIGDVVFESLLSDIYYGFIVKYGLDGIENSYLEERYVYEPTKFLYDTTETKIIKTYLRNSSHAQRTAQRYTYFNRNAITKISLRIPHSLQIDGTIDESLHTVGEYIKVTVDRGPGPESEFGGEFGQYRKTYELLKIQDSSKQLALSGDNIKGLAINAGYWTNPAGDDPKGNWTNDDGESIPGDDTTKNISLWT